MEERLRQWVEELATLKALEQVGPKSTNRRNSQVLPKRAGLYLAPSSEQQGQAHSSPSDTISVMMTLPSSHVAAAMAEAEVNLFQMAIQVHGYNHGSQLQSPNSEGHTTHSD